MSAPWACGNVTTTGASPAWCRAAAVTGRAPRLSDARGSRASTMPAQHGRDVMTAPSGRIHEVPRPVPHEPQQPASQTLPAPSGRQPSERHSADGASGLASMARSATPKGQAGGFIPCAVQQPREASPRSPQTFPNPPGGLTMQKPAPRFFYAMRKFVHQAENPKTERKTQESDCKSLKQRSYTLCEVVVVKTMRLRAAQVNLSRPLP